MEIWKEGMEIAPREDGKPPEPPEGFTIVTTESGVMVLRKKRTRNLQKLGMSYLCSITSANNSKFFPSKLDKFFYRHWWVFSKVSF